MDLIFYTSVRTSNGKFGIGIHGFSFVKGQTKNKPNKYLVTENGYVKQTPNNNREVVNPVSYIEATVANKGSESDNFLALTAISETLLATQELADVKSVVIFSTSAYALAVVKKLNINNDHVFSGGFNKKPIESIRQSLKSMETTITFSYIRKDEEEIGIELADDLCQIALNVDVMNKLIVRTFDPKGFWKPKKIKNPLLDATKIFMLDAMTVDEYTVYNITSIKEEEEIGVPTNDIIDGVLLTNVQMERVDEIAKLSKSIQDSKPFFMITLEVFRDINYSLYNRYGKDMFVTIGSPLGLTSPKLHRSKALGNPKRVEIVKELYPPGRWKRAITQTTNLLEYYNCVKGRNNDYDISILNDLIYDNGKCVVPMSEKSLKVPLRYGKKERKIKMYLGNNLPSRNTLKRIEKLNPQVYLMSDSRHENMIKYSVVVSCDSGWLLLTNSKTNVIFLK